jgi:hyperosmotically inducible protein
MSILRSLIVLVVIIAGVFLVMGYVGGLRTGQVLNRPDIASSDTAQQARERGAEIGEKVGAAAAKVEETLDESALTAKIKAKMALDDSVKARAISVTTRGTTVTLSGTVDTKAEHDRALALARETDGVTKVIDDLHTR